MTNFTECEARFTANTPDGELLRRQWGWNGTIFGIVYNNMTQISREGCIHVCGSEADLYAWRDISGVITTWVLPTIGILLQAPFESNAARRTVLAITRWVGSPIASLSYVLWNIKVSAKAALMVDMAVKYDDKTPEYEELDCTLDCKINCTRDCTTNCTAHCANHRTTDFASMRDSMYLLLVLNQYTLNSTVMSKDNHKEAECLLRITLFSRDLILKDADKTLREMRRILAQEVRETRRRGTVPVFISILWFLFAFALSIQDAFSELGANTTAHDLALGCLLAWFPVLIMSSIVDRNPIAAEAIRKKLNTLVDHVRISLRDPPNRREYLKLYQGEENYPDLEDRIENVAKKERCMDEFFVDFAGQARVRWHYGAAHAILCDIEDCYIQKKGRDWLAIEHEARAYLVLGAVNDEGLVWFDFREFWQIFSAIVIVGGSCGGAFILSYFTPTIGLGCRSGGYTIFFSVATGLLIVEMAVWMYFSPYEITPRWLTLLKGYLHKHGISNYWTMHAQPTWERLGKGFSNVCETMGDLLVCCIVSICLKWPWGHREGRRERVEKSLEKTQAKWDLVFFRPIELFNTIWLMYIVMAQVTGLYRTCNCITSNWAGGGGYLDFSQQFTSNGYGITLTWVSGTSLTASVMGLSMFYITVEWCQQSHLSTEDYDDAMEGLRLTRKYRLRTMHARRISRATLAQLGKLGFAIGKLINVVGADKKPRKTLMWTWDTTKKPVLSRADSAYARNNSYRHPTFPFERTRNIAGTHNAVLDTSATAHSSSSPAITPRGIHNESNAPVVPLSVPSGSRISDDSSTPFIPTALQEHQQHEVEDPMSNEEHSNEEHSNEEHSNEEHSNEEHSNEETPFFEQGRMRTSTRTWLNPPNPLQNRRGYRRAKSDPEFSHDGGDVGNVELVVSQEPPNRR